MAGHVVRHYFVDDMRGEVALIKTLHTLEGEGDSRKAVLDTLTPPLVYASSTMLVQVDCGSEYRALTLKRGPSVELLSTPEAAIQLVADMASFDDPEGTIRTNPESVTWKLHSTEEADINAYSAG